MSDSDVQDVRDLVAKQKEDASAQLKVMQRMKRMAEKPLDEEDVQMFLQLKDVVAARKEKEREREARLGVAPPGQSASTSAQGKLSFYYCISTLLLIRSGMRSRVIVHLK